MSAALSRTQSGGSNMVRTTWSVSSNTADVTAIPIAHFNRVRLGFI
jgi:hypothetical protein